MQTTRNCIGFRDDDVTRRVESYLGSKHFPCFRDLDVEVHEGVVTITGIVDNFHQRQVALNSCRRVAGVLHLIDEILVHASTENEPGPLRRTK